MWKGGIEVFSVVAYDKDNDIYDEIESGIEFHLEAVYLARGYAAQIEAGEFRRKDGAEEPYDLVSVYSDWGGPSEKMVWSSIDAKQTGENLGKSCLTCIHKDVCIKRSMTIFTLFIQTGRYDEVKGAQVNLDVCYDCENWKEGER